MLTGTMRAENGRRKLVENAWKADGVKQVIDEVLVSDRTSFGQGLEDTRIEQAIRTKYVVSGNVRSSNYKIAVSGAVVYLLGVARDKSELDRALEAASKTAGVNSVIRGQHNQSLIDAHRLVDEGKEVGQQFGRARSPIISWGAPSPILWPTRRPRAFTKVSVSRPWATN